MSRARSSVNRNAPCPCGSGRKYKKCCQGKPESAAGGRAEPGGETLAMLRSAFGAAKAGNLEAASDLYRRVLETDPDHRGALAGLGQIMGQLGDVPEGIRLLKRATAAPDAPASTHVQHASLLQQGGLIEAAIEATQRALAIDAGSADAHAMTAVCHERMNRIDEAIAAIERALAIDPEDGTAGVTRARLLRRAGRLDEARGHLERLIEAATIRPRTRQMALNEFGIVLDRLGEHAAAFEVFGRCNREKSAGPAAQRADREMQPRRIAAYREKITPELLTRAGGVRFDDGFPAPAFLMGFPRSGTTMTEQIIGAHEDAVTTDELPLLRFAREELARLIPDADDDASRVARAGPDQIRRARAAYWQAVARYADADLDGKVFLDKQPLNIIDVALINVVFPEARVLVALRDPRDVCLSCFMQWFQANASMVHFLDIERTGAFYAEVMGLWLHLRGMLTVAWMEVRYEDTVDDLEAQARRILEHLGLDWSDEVLRFHEKARARFISTPSFAAVTQPINRKAVGRWHNYADALAPIAEPLRPFVEAFGYA